MKLKSKAIITLILIVVLICCIILIHEKIKIKPKYVIKSTPLTLSLIKPEIVIRITEEDLINCVPLNIPLVKPRIEISKQKRKLLLYSDGEVVRIYNVALGYNPVDDKEKRGDYCTPEGEFYICKKNSQSQFYLSLGISYPNTEDAARGLREGIISQRQYEAIIRAIRSQETPPWNTPLGGAIFIHGHGTAWDWTYGCIALENKRIKELYNSIPIGTPVLIYRDSA